MKRLWQEEAGQDLVEYSLLLTLLALVAVVSMKTIGSVIKNVFSTAATNITTVS